VTTRERSVLLAHYNRKGGKLERSKLAWELPTLRLVIEGNIEEKAKGTRRGRRRSKQLWARIKKLKVYWNLRENVDLQYRYFCRTRFGRG
jgi:hypothetical protein